MASVVTELYRRPVENTPYTRMGYKVVISGGSTGFTFATATGDAPSSFVDVIAVGFCAANNNANADIYNNSGDITGVDFTANETVKFEAVVLI